MSDLPNGSLDHRRPSDSDSLGSIDVYFDGAGDNTIAPCPPELLEPARAMREKLIRYGAIKAPPGRDLSQKDTPGEAGA